MNRKTELLKQLIREEVKRQLMTESRFVAFYMGKKIEIEGKDLWDAKQQAILQFKVPKSKIGMLAVVSAKSMEDQDFKYN